MMGCQLASFSGERQRKHTLNVYEEKGRRDGGRRENFVVVATSSDTLQRLVLGRGMEEHFRGE